MKTVTGQNAFGKTLLRYGLNTARAVENTGAHQKRRAQSDFATVCFCNASAANEIAFGKQETHFDIVELIANGKPFLMYR